ncbi:MAG: FAD-dependent oxidoreductase [Acidimicrobiia bacterium]|nr:FAD-dependent oxidoreductase [Acidimicrobiia bacterium]
MELTAFGPDFPFPYDSWLAHPAGLGRVPADAHGTPVAIVGAGVAGLVAAHELMALGLRPVVYEAGRIGGRLRSEPFAAAPDVVAELGGMRFPISSAALYHYIGRCDLETRDFPNPLTPFAPTTVIDLEGVGHFAHTIDDLPPLFREVADAWDTALEAEAQLAEIQDAMRRRDAAAVKALWNPLVNRWDDRTFYDFVATSDAFARLSFRHREVFGQVGFGTGGWDSDFPNSMLEILRVVMAGFETAQRYIVGGAERLPRRLWTLPAGDPTHWPAGTSLAALHHGVPRPGVARIARHPDGDLVVTDRWGRADCFAAVLVTTQSWLLTTSIAVDEGLLSHKVWMALDRTCYTQSSKTFVMVDRPFWHDVDPATGRPVMSMTLTDRNTRGTYLLDNGPDRPAVILLSYAWQSDAQKMLPLSARQRAELALATLDQIYPRADIRSHVLGDPITVSWESDPNFQGAFKGALPGHYRYNHRMYGHFFGQEALPPHHRGLFLAGDDVSWTPGWAEGAVQTALNAVWGVVHHLGGASAADNPGPGELYPEWGPVALPDQQAE